METYHTESLHSAPIGCSPGWKLTFEILSKPIGLICGIRNRLSCDFGNKIPTYWLNDLHYCNENVSTTRQLMQETLDVLKTVGAYKTWDIGSAIQDAAQPVEYRLACGKHLSSSYSEIMDFLRQLFEDSKRFSEQALLSDLQRAIREESHICIERRFLNAGETDAHFGIVAPVAISESPVRGADAPKMSDNKEVSYLDCEFKASRAMYALKAFDQESRKSIPEIAKKGERKPYPNVGPYRQAIPLLVQKGLAASKEGRGGGAWLTLAGQEFVKSLKRRR